VLQPRVPRQQVVGDVQDVIRFVVGQVDLEQIKPLVDLLVEAQPLHQQVSRPDAAGVDLGAELGGQHPVERGRAAAPLEVAEHDRRHVAMQSPGQFLGHDLADSAQPHLLPGGLRPAVHEPLVGQVGPLRHDDQREPLALGFPAENLPAHVLEAPGNLRQEDHVAAPGRLLACPYTSDVGRSWPPCCPLTPRNSPPPRALSSRPP